MLDKIGILWYNTLTKPTVLFMKGRDLMALTVKKGGLLYYRKNSLTLKVLIVSVMLVSVAKPVRVDYVE